MNTSSNYKANKLFSDYLNEISSDDQSETFLKEEGIDTTQLLSRGLRKIRQIKMNLAAEQTEQKYQSMKASASQKAKDYVQNLLADSAFSLEKFLKTEKLTVAYKNFENMTEDEVREFLERHFMLKFGKE